MYEVGQRRLSRRFLSMGSSGGETTKQKGEERKRGSIDQWPEHLKESSFVKSERIKCTELIKREPRSGRNSFGRGGKGGIKATKEKGHIAPQLSFGRLFFGGKA